MGWCPCRILVSRFGGRPARFFPSTKQLRPANSLNIRRRVGKAGDWLSLHRSSACASAGDGAPRRPRSHPDYLAGGDGHSPGLHSTPCIGEVSRRRCLPVRRRAATRPDLVAAGSTRRPALALMGAERARFRIGAPAACRPFDDGLSLAGQRGQRSPPPLRLDLHVSSRAGEWG